jgi:hypothetical protein
MITNAKRDSIFAFEIAIVEAAAMCGRRSAHLLFDTLQGAYDLHMERVQMRLAPDKLRSWRDIPRAGGQDSYRRIETRHAHEAASSVDGGGRS